jgi:aspartate-semialdehyde dehydrogenase
MTRPHESVRVAIAGAASLRGKELKLWLEESEFPAAEIRLLDEELVAGTLTEAGGEPAVIETVNEDSFERVRFAFFSGSAGFSIRHAGEARRAGAVVIDLSGGLFTESGAKPWIPALDSVLPPPVGKPAPGESQSLFLAPSAPADVAISLCAALQPMGTVRLALSFFQPVSELGREAVEELENQVVNLLSFQPAPQSVFDTQVGFNMLSSYGSESRANLAAIQTSIVDEVRGYLAGRLAMPAIALVQAPVFYSHVFMAYAEFEAAPAPEELVTRLKQAGLKVVAGNDEAPTNVNVAGEARPVLRQPERDPSIERGVWLWGAADNLRVPVANASAIAEKLLAS